MDGVCGGESSATDCDDFARELGPCLRSRSTDRFGLGLSDGSNGVPIPPVTPTSGKFVDPLVARRQAKLEAQLSAGPPPPKALVGKKKVPVGELVAFFDQEKA